MGIRLGIIGCGGFVGSHCRAIRDHVPEFEFVGLADPVRSHAERIRDERVCLPDVPIYDNYPDMLEKARPEAVIVSTPHMLHYEHCAAALDAGAHVMVEKPMVVGAENARRLAEKAREAGKVLQVAIQGAYTDTFAYARELISDGTLGPLQLASGVMAQNWMKLTAGSWRQQPELSGGGQLNDSTTHVIGAMLFLVDSPVVEAFCWTDPCGTPVDINAVATVRFANGCLATLTSGGNCAPFVSRLSLQGANAYLDISPHGGGFKVTLPPEAKGEEVREILEVPGGWGVPTVTPAKNFAEAIRGDAEPRCPAELGIRLAELMDCLYESSRTGRPTSP